MVRAVTTADHPAMRSFTSVIALALVLVGCAAAAPAASPSAPSVEPSSPTPGLARPEPADGAYFGLNLDWGNWTAAEVVDRLGRTPAVWVEFARFPLDDGGRANLDRFIDQVAAVGGTALITLEPHDGLGAVTREAANDLADVLAGYWATSGVPTFVRFGHEMNGSWYSWSQQPVSYKNESAWVW